VHGAIICLSVALFLKQLAQYRFARLVGYPLRANCPRETDTQVRGESCIVAAAGTAAR